MTDYYRKEPCGHVGPWPGDPHTCIEIGTVENPGIGVNCDGTRYTPAPEVGALVEANYRSPEERADQKALGWPDWHPEHFCGRCGFRNVQSWWTTNEAFDVPERGPSDIICPQCLSEQTGGKHGYITWAFLPDEVVTRLTDSLRDMMNGPRDEAAYSRAESTLAALPGKET